MTGHYRLGATTLHRSRTRTIVPCAWCDEPASFWYQVEEDHDRCPSGRPRIPACSLRHLRWWLDSVPLHALPFDPR